VAVVDIDSIFIPKERRRKLSVKEVQLRLNNYAEQAAVLQDEGHQHSHSHDGGGDDDDGCGVRRSGDDEGNDGSHADDDDYDDDDLNRDDNDSDDGAMFIHRPSECFDDISNDQQSMMQSSTDGNNVITTDIIMKSISNNNITNNKNDNNSNNSNNNIIDGDIINRQHTNTILYYCACLIGTMPGTLYLTSTNILFSSSTITLFFSSILQPKREVFSLSSLHRTSLPISRLKRQQHASLDSSNSSNNYSPSSSSISTSAIKSMLSWNTLTLTFQEDGSRFVDVFISPLVIDCAKLQMIIMEVKSAFHSVSTDIDGF